MTENRWLRWIQWLLVLTLPVLLLAANLRLVTSHWFVRWEYRRAGFPPDPFGLSTVERIRLAEVCQDYLATNADLSLLADLQLPGGEAAFNERELRHMADVQAVYLGVTIAGLVAAHHRRAHVAARPHRATTASGSYQRSFVARASASPHDAPTTPPHASSSARNCASAISL